HLACCSVSCTILNGCHMSSTRTSLFSFFLPPPGPSCSTPFPYTTLFRSGRTGAATALGGRIRRLLRGQGGRDQCRQTCAGGGHRSEEHTSELQSRFDIVCRLLLEKKKL